MAGNASTITSVTLGRGKRVGPQRPRPVLLKLIECDDPRALSARHVLDEVEVVEVGRGERGARRDGNLLEVRVPEQFGRMRARAVGTQKRALDMKPERDGPGHAWRGTARSHGVECRLHRAAW